jgi:uncharacterized protein YeaO (DUF488 family)
MAVKLKRVYEHPERADGVRILVDRLWPRGLSKDNAALDEWLREIAPTDSLRKWFGHKEERWAEFQRRYRKELAKREKKELIGRLRKISTVTTLTLLYASRDGDRNNAVALAKILEGRKR